jgi:hypothetical protein
MHEQNNGAIFGALIDIGNAQSANFGVVGLIRKVGQVLKSFLGCAKKTFDVRQLAHETGSIFKWLENSNKLKSDD